MDSIVKGDRPFGPLARLEGATPMVAGVGQMLVHRDHIPPGCFVVLQGTLLVSDGQHVQFVQVALDGEPVLVPPVDELDDAATRSVRVEVGTRLLYLPRSVLTSDPAAVRVLKAAGLRAISLQSSLSWSSLPS